MAFPPLYKSTDGFIEVTCSDLGDNIDILIGMDIISLGDFAISNYGGKTLFSFIIPPLKSKINFVKKADSLNKKHTKKKKKK